MSSYLADRTITVLPFTQQPDGEETIIANATQTSFLSLPTSAVDILHWLAEGKTVAESQKLYQETYDELPDMDDFLELLEGEGFILSNGSQQETASPVHQEQARPRRYHFESFSQELARRIFSRPVLFVCVLCIGAGLFLTIIDPSLIPTPEILVFKQNLTLMSIGLYLLIFPAVFLHEMAHLIAARAAGVPARLSISHRLWVLVAQTDMTGIWLAPKRQRLLAVLAGSILDATVSGLLIMLLFAQQHAWINLFPAVVLFCRIALFTYLIRLLWQCYFFVRTDFYYVVAIAFNCKDLMGDAEALLRNLAARVLPLLRRVEQARIPTREMRVIEAYAFVWVAGRLVAFLSLFFIGLPILLGYYFEIGRFLLNGQSPTALAPADIAGWFTLIAVPTVLQTAGFVLWLRSLVLARRIAHGTPGS
ncbi:MAG TPA: hypothetical protein VGF67_23155 [Ktedonobacteraceae bacterium]|jgi:hypothetical protein